MNLERIPPRPVAEGAPDPETIFMQWVWDVCARKFIDTPTVRFNADRNSIRAHASASGGGGDFDPFPFGLYQGSTWLKWKVRTGYVVQTGAPWIPSLVDTEFTLTSGVLHSYFWLDVDAQEIKCTGLTTWSPKKILLGWVDTQTYSAASRAVPYNLRKFIFTPCA